MHSFPTLMLLSSLLSLSACEGVKNPRALGEPIIVHQATFKEGALPGSEKPNTDLPVITSFTVGAGVFRPGTSSVPISGRTGVDAYAIAVSLIDDGTGYWVRPVGAEDLLVPGERNWEASFDIGYDLAPGRHQLGVVALDEQGQGGQQYRLEVCVTPDYPDRGNTCDPTKEPPEAVASLRWSSDADLDLLVIGPDGTRYGRQNFFQVDDNKSIIARLDGDGVSSCSSPTRRVENFAWLKKPKKGTWYVYTNLFDACQKPAVRFEVTTYRKKKRKDGSFSLVEEKSVGGELLRAQTKSDAEKPLYLTSIEFP